MLEYIILGAAQGIFEWLPISSEGVIVLLKTNVFGSASLSESIHEALFLHLGTFFAALIYFRQDIFRLGKKVTRLRYRSYKQYSPDDKVIIFLAVSTIITGLLGVVLLQILSATDDWILKTGRIVTGAIGCMLLITGYLQLRTKRNGDRREKDLTVTDSLVLGIVQGFSVLPGLSRSGLTISTLLFRHINDTVSLRLSFLMSLPVVLLGNVFLNSSMFSISLKEFVGLLVAFIVGLASIHGLMILARKINFGIFVIIFGVITIIASVI